MISKSEFNKTIVPFALVGYEIGYSQLGLSGHIQRALMEQLLIIELVFAAYIILKFS